MITRKIVGYWKRLNYEFNRWKWNRFHHRCSIVYRNWKQDFLQSKAQVILGAHFHLQGGVRNHLLAIKKFSSLDVLLVPDECYLQKYGVSPFNEHKANFNDTKPPSSAIAVHTHVLPWLIDWARINAPKRLRWIHTHHLLYTPEHGRNDLEPWQKALNDAMLDGARNSDICICVSRWEQDVLKNQYHIPSIYIPNGIDSTFSEKANPQRFLRKYKTSNHFVLWVGRDDPVKNPSDFIKLAAQLHSTQFVMIGGLNKNDIKNNYNLAVPKNLQLLPLVPRQDVLDAISACKAIVVTSLREGLPTLVLEAMTLEKQIVVSNIAGCLDATNGEDHARVYELGNIDQLSTQTHAALSDRSQRTAAKLRVLEEFDWRVIAKKLDRLYQGHEP